MEQEKELPPYSGRDTKCPKCGYVGASSQHLAYGKCIHGGPMLEIMGFTPNERIHRECSNCSYMWDEAVIEFDRTGIPK